MAQAQAGYAAGRPTAAAPHRGGGYGYSVAARRLAIATFNAVGRAAYSAIRTAQQLQPGVHLPCVESVRQWQLRNVATGSVEPDARKHVEGGTDGRPVSSRIVGFDLLLLSLFKIANPAATGDTCRNFLQNVSATHTRPSRKRVSDAITDSVHGLGMSRKKLQIIATEQDPVRNHQWFALPPPVGCNGVPVASLVDVDESGYYYNTAGHADYGHAFVGTVAQIRAVKTPGVKFTMIAAIASDGSRYIRIRPMAGTSILEYYDYMTIDVLPFCGQGRYIMDDNLSAHTSPIVLQAIAQSNCFHLSRPTYNPQVAPIEYFFAEVKKALKRVSPRLTPATFMQEILNAAQGVSNMAIANTSTHCGYL